MDRHREEIREAVINETAKEIGHTFCEWFGEELEPFVLHRLAYAGIKVARVNLDKIGEAFDEDELFRRNKDYNAVSTSTEDVPEG